MAWIRLHLDCQNIAPVDLWTKIVDAMKEHNLWVAQVYEGDTSFICANSFDTYQDLCRGIWTNWPSNKLDTFLDSYQVGDRCPIIFSKYQPMWYFVVKDLETAKKIIATKVDLIKAGEGCP